MDDIGQEISMRYTNNLTTEAINLLRRHNLLKSLVRAEIVEGAVKDIEVDKKITDKVWDKYLKENKIDNEDELQAHALKIGHNIESLRWQLELPIRVKAYSISNFQHKAEARFLAKKNTLDRVIYSLLRVKDALLARELYLRIAGRENDFADLAETYSMGPEAKTRGVIGPVPMNQAHPALSERLRTSKSGQLLEPFNAKGWWLVARLERYEPASFGDTVSQVMVREMFEEWLEEAVTCKMAEL